MSDQQPRPTGWANEGAHTSVAWKKTADGKSGDGSLWLDDGDVRLYHGDNLDVLRTLPDRSVHMCATSPPFYGLRDYGTGEWEGGDPDCDHKAGGEPQLHVGSDGKLGRNNTNWDNRHGAYGATCGKCGARRVDKQIGLEETPDQWVENLVTVFREVRRVLRNDGTLWVEVGDSYARAGGWSDNSGLDGLARGESGRAVSNISADGNQRLPNGYKQKDLLGQPWLLAFALRADGWWLRSEIIWARPNPMPESVTDRPTKSHSTVFLLSKQPRYFYDADAIRQPSSVKPEDMWRTKHPAYNAGGSKGDGGRKPSVAFRQQYPDPENGANARSVWQIPTQPTPFAHFATWPEALCRRMILAGTSEKGCCPECGAAWVRDTLVELTEGGNGGPGGVGRRLDGTRDAMPRMTKSTQTLGWSPSCNHDHQPVPCTVLDPFAGSATTMLVARNHGRHSIGIELNEDYLQIAAKRLQQLSLLA